LNDWRFDRERWEVLEIPKVLSSTEDAHTKSMGMLVGIEVKFFTLLPCVSFFGSRETTVSLNVDWGSTPLLFPHQVEQLGNIN